MLHHTALERKHNSPLICSVLNFLQSSLCVETTRLNRCLPCGTTWIFNNKSKEHEAKALQALSYHQQTLKDMDTGHKNTTVLLLIRVIRCVLEMSVLVSSMWCSDCSASVNEVEFCGSQVWISVIPVACWASVWTWASNIWQRLNQSNHFGSTIKSVSERAPGMTVLVGRIGEPGPALTH